MILVVIFFILLIIGLFTEIDSNLFAVFMSIIAVAVNILGVIEIHRSKRQLWKQEDKKHT